MLQQQLCLMMEMFLEVCIHGALYYREIYPRTLFEQRQLGKLFGCQASEEGGHVWLSSLLVWQCRHPDVTAYVKRVLTNIKPLIQANAVERVILAVKSKRGESLDHFSIKCGLEDGEGAASVGRSVGAEDSEFRSLQEEMVSAILRLSALESNPNLPRPPADCTWTLLCVTRAADESAGGGEAVGALRSALHGGEWMVDNNQLTEQAALSRQVRVCLCSTSAMVVL